VNSISESKLDDNTYIKLVGMGLDSNHLQIAVMNEKREALKIQGQTTILN
jgi:hypothetical protein